MCCSPRTACSRSGPRSARKGFGESERVRTPWDEERGPAVVLADGTETVFLADMTGDGLSDIVRVRNGEVCYWPNLGYGRFGAKVTMDGAPRFVDEERFDPRRVRLADIDGSGTTDLLYVADDGVYVCFNQIWQRVGRAAAHRGVSRPQTRSARCRCSTCSAPARRASCGRRRCPGTPRRRCATSI